MPAIITGFFSAAGSPLEIWQYENADVVTPDPDPKTCSYTHFNLSSENLGHTSRYNCWGFTFLPRRYWVRRSAVDTLLQDNCDPVPDGMVEVGDVIRYQDLVEGQLLTQHTGRVWQTDGAGHAIWIRSKWGGSGEYIHVPSNVPSIYGTNLAYFRQKAPLKGDPAETNKIADLWIKDSPGDNGQQGMRAPWWTSPDILVDIPPYDGAPDINPVFDHQNRIWAVVRNRTNQQVDNVYVRFYWADPAAGLPPASWNLIPGTPGHPNPLGPLTIGANADIETDYVEWTPTASPAHQCLLAIAYINDDPRDSNNPDPLVYPFEIPWDNNIAQRNVHVEEMENGANKDVSINVGNPFPQGEAVKGSLTAILTYSPGFPLLGYPKKIIPVKVSLNLRLKDTWVTLKPGDDMRRFKSPFLPDKLGLRERIIAGLTLPRLTFPPGKPHRLDIKISVPKGAVKGSVYYLHITQTISGMVTGGYTVVVKVI